MANATRRFGLAVAALGLVAVATGQARAGQALSYDFTGHISSATGSYAPYAGMTVSGTFSFDPAAASIDHRQTTFFNIDSYRTGAIRLAVDGTATNFDADPSVAGITTSVIDNSRFGGDEFRMGGYHSAIEQVVLSLADPSQSAFGSTALPTSLDPSLFSSRTITIVNTNESYYDENYFDYLQAGVSVGLDSISPHTLDAALATPEPSTLISAATAGLMGLGYGWRRRRKARLAA